MADDFGAAKVNTQGHSSWLMASLRKTWFSLSIQDPAFFHCLLSYYAGNFYQDLKLPDSGVVLQYRTISINIVTERLGYLEHGVSDGTIGAVAGMSLYEVGASPEVHQFYSILLSINAEKLCGSPIWVHSQAPSCISRAWSRW